MMAKDEFTRSIMHSIGRTAGELRRQDLDYLAVQIIKRLSEAIPG